MILDEAHKIKNPDAKITKAFHDLAPLLKKRLILTGSPIANRPYDLWSQIWFLDQGAALGQDFRRFKKMLDLPRDTDADPIGQDQGIAVFEDELGELFPKIKSFSVRETKSTAGIHLPTKHYRQIPTEFENDQRAMYETIRDEMRVEVLKDGLLEEDISDDLLKRLLRLVQVTSNPRLIDERYDKEPGKVGPLRELVNEIVESSEKAIIWTSFVDNVGWLSSLFSEFNPVQIHGGMGSIERQKSVDGFLEQSETKLLVATPQSAKEGLTLTVANHVIFYDRTFSLDDYIQAQDRIHRISQERDCFVYNLIIDGSIDTWTNTLLKAKQVAASYGQGDIGFDEYRREMRYDVSGELRSLLGIED
jgi:SNF2 family DNA or RNA helicase